jgi:hypothetical protein
MNAKEYSKKYDLAINFKIVSETAFKAGLEEGRNEQRSEYYKNLENKFDKLKQENIELKEILYDGEKLADFLGGM